LHKIIIKDIFQKKSKFLTWQSSLLNIFSVLNKNEKIISQYQVLGTFINAINGILIFITIVETFFRLYH
jgi:hypothetical protein